MDQHGLPEEPRGPGLFHVNDFQHTRTEGRRGDDDDDDGDDDDDDGDDAGDDGGGYDEDDDYDIF